MSKSTKFNTEWIGVGPDSNVRARCVLCGVKIELGNMGRQALISHSKGKKHMNNTEMSKKIKQESLSLDGFHVEPTTSESEVTPESMKAAEASGPLVPAPTSIEVSCTQKGIISNCMYVTNDKVLLKFFGH